MTVDIVVQNPINPSLCGQGPNPLVEQANQSLLPRNNEAKKQRIHSQDLLDVQEILGLESKVSKMKGICIQGLCRVSTSEITHTQGAIAIASNQGFRPPSKGSTCEQIM